MTRAAAAAETSIPTYPQNTQAPATCKYLLECFKLSCARSHFAAKNFVPGKEAASTKVSAAVIALQERLPKARVLYCSATGVSEVRSCS